MTAQQCSPISRVSIARRPFGRLPDRRQVEAIELGNRHGTTVTILTWGATLQSVRTRDGSGKVGDIQPGYRDLAGYLRDRLYRGVTIGRYANRIAGACFPLDGRAVRLSANAPPHSLHGGEHGFDRSLWAIDECRGDPNAMVTLRLESRDGDQGYPGRLLVTATFTLDNDNQLQIAYRATTDAPTVVNLTHHGYWNLAGDRSSNGVARQIFQTPATRFLPIGIDRVPLGGPRDVAGTAFDFTTPVT